MWIFLVFFLFGILIFIMPKYIKFRGSKYQQTSGNNFLKTLFDKGKYGEFLIFTQLEKLKGNNKLLANLYLPKKDGKTTEVDIIMLTETGIYVFESKNYSGWIFGNEKNKNWTQTLPNKQKEQFFNPIWQNQGHINALKSVLGLNDDALFKSLIVFSERCTLKKINVASPNVRVIKRNALISTVKKEMSNRQSVLTNFQLENIFGKLKKYSHQDDLVKKEHIGQVRLKR
jgi:hypothetical protein